MTKKLDKEDARQGKTGQNVRWVLFISTSIAFVVLLLIYLSFA